MRDPTKQGASAHVQPARTSSVRATRKASSVPVLTPRLADALEVFRTYAKVGRSPTSREVGKALGLTGKGNGAKWMLAKLVELGALRHGAKRSRRTYTLGTRAIFVPIGRAA